MMVFATTDAKMDNFPMNATLLWEENGAKRELYALAIGKLSQSCSSSFM